MVMSTKTIKLTTPIEELWEEGLEAVLEEEREEFAAVLYELATMIEVVRDSQGRPVIFRAKRH